MSYYLFDAKADFLSNESDSVLNVYEHLEEMRNWLGAPVMVAEKDTWADALKLAKQKNMSFVITDAEYNEIATVASAPIDTLGEVAFFDGQDRLITLAA